jgi:hypothetical protein
MGNCNESPATYSDPTGLIPQKPGQGIGELMSIQSGRYDDHCCNKAEEDRKKGGLWSIGFVACCYGRPVACQIDVGVKNPGFHECVTQHEKLHFADVDCDPTCIHISIHRKGMKDTIECAHYEKTFECLTKMRARDCGKTSGADKIECQATYDLWLSCTVKQGSMFCKNVGKTSPYKAPGKCDLF